MTEEPKVVLKSYILSIIVIDEPSSLARIVGVISGRGFNIKSLTVAPTNGEVSRITLVCRAPDEPERMVINQIMQQIGKLVQVTRVRDLTDDPEAVVMGITVLRIDGDLAAQQRVLGAMSATVWMRHKQTEKSLFIFSTDASTQKIKQDQIAFGKLEGVKNVARASSGAVAIGGIDIVGPEVR